MFTQLQPHISLAGAKLEVLGLHLSHSCFLWFGAHGDRMLWFPSVASGAKYLLDVFGLGTCMDEMSHTHFYMSECWEGGSLCRDKESRETCLLIKCISTMLEWLPNRHRKGDSFPCKAETEGTQGSASSRTAAEARSGSASQSLLLFLFLSYITPPVYT